ncbi:Hepatic triacylglycerol lipase [Halotydeus destructor]|nr:Hepatic triacylglycerol lipase [Halotydeus destructor]
MAASLAAEETSHVENYSNKTSTVKSNKTSSAEELYYSKTTKNQTYVSQAKRAFSDTFKSPFDKSSDDEDSDSKSDKLTDTFKSPFDKSSDDKKSDTKSDSKSDNFVDKFKSPFSKSSDDKDSDSKSDKFTDKFKSPFSKSTDDKDSDSKSDKLTDKFKSPFSKSSDDKDSDGKIEFGNKFKSPFDKSSDKKSDFKSDKVTDNFKSPYKSGSNPMKMFFSRVEEDGASCKKPKEEKCFDDVGCFVKNKGPLKHLCLLPDDEPGEQMLLYRKDNDEPVPITPNKTGLIDGATKLALISPGWSNKIGSDIITIKDKLMQVGGYSQVIIVKTIMAEGVEDFAQAMANSEYVGRKVGLLLQRVIDKNGLDHRDIYLVGFSMGCQVVHFAAKWVKDKLGAAKKPGRITALDPGAPLTDGYPDSQVSRKDAIFVDVIHTSAGFKRAEAGPSLQFQRIGYASPLGHVDFYPNGGGYQGSCGPLDDVGCKHDHSKLYFIKSFSDCEYKSESCMLLNVYQKESYCSGRNTTDGSRMGFYANKQDGRDIQVLQVEKKEPFCSKKDDDDD